MWSVWLIFCDCGFHSACPLMDKDKRLMEASWWERLTWGANWVLFWWVGPCSVNLQSNFLLMGGAVFSPCCLIWGQTVVEVMKIMLTFFKRSQASKHCCTQCPHPAAGHLQPTPPPETPGHSWASLGQSLVGSLLLSPGSWCAQDLVCALQESVSPVLCKFWLLYGEVNGDPTEVCCTQSPCPCGSTLMTCISTGDSETQFWLSLWVLVHTKFGWALRASLVGMGLDSKCDFTPPTIFLGLLLCPWT